MIYVRGKELEVPLSSVKAIYERKTMDRSVGERVILQYKIKQGGSVFEKGSRQIVRAIPKVGLVRFESGLEPFERAAVSEPKGGEFAGPGTGPFGVFGPNKRLF